jgi:replicative DNA helicase
MTDKRDEFNALPEQAVEPENKPAPISEFFTEYYNTLGNGSLTLLGIATGFESLDKATLGLDGLIVLGGIAGQGKTSLALQLALNACNNTPTLFYSLEMPRRAIFTKALSCLGEVRYSDILLNGKNLSKKLDKGYKEIADKGKSLYVRTGERGQAPINFETLENEINYLKVSHQTERVFVVIDHLQVFNAGEYRDQIDKENKLITGFKGVSERTGAVILLISQKNKAGFETTGGLQAIKGSVDIVYLADVVMFLEPKVEKKSKGCYSEIDESDSGDVKEVFLNIAKNRYNAPKKICFEFNGAYSQFKEPVHPF